MVAGGALRGPRGYLWDGEGADGFSKVVTPGAGGRGGGQGRLAQDPGAGQAAPGLRAEEAPEEEPVPGGRADLSGKVRGRGAPLPAAGGPGPAVGQGGGSASAVEGEAGRPRVPEEAAGSDARRRGQLRPGKGQAGPVLGGPDGGVEVRGGPQPLGSLPPARSEAPGWPGPPAGRDAQGDARAQGRGRGGRVCARGGGLCQEGREKRPGAPRGGVQAEGRQAGQARAPGAGVQAG
eukprot:CAMPEP_0198461546 /NCGR_PEP_ID=MMETSP1456-20131121/267_1 /TAXON_ID=1461544 ORGANISM="Unidentified sp., Strain RCC1871" /NCGR_SAMPLE_ID=MMETSP1456 /ASSEMBLY_ACC=CAM_ASM_001119 /LENGTH=234 /DNA_ID=CAMNT_0044186585 /DNA_START=502 /DNA_END=1201 /DNA_ORIENTATION=-